LPANDIMSNPASASTGASAVGARIASLALGTIAPRSDITVSSCPNVSAPLRSISRTGANIDVRSSRFAPTSPTARMSKSFVMRRPAGLRP
jgi:hypothetical protein